MKRRINFSLALQQRTPVGRLTDRRPASWFEIRRVYNPAIYGMQHLLRSVASLQCLTQTRLRQMTYRDNVDGTFEAGRRVKWEVFNEYGIDDAEILRARHGHPLLLIDTSPRHPYGRDLEAREAHVPCRDGRHRVTTQRHIGPAHVRVRFT